MAASDWRFPLILITAMVIAIFLTFAQQRAYNRKLNEALATSHSKTDMLVSGRGRSFWGGAIVIMLVDTATREITWAQAMTGRTVFARFKELPTLLGPLENVSSRLAKPSKPLIKAIEMATEQVSIAEQRKQAGCSTMVRKPVATPPSPRGNVLRLRDKTSRSIERK